MNKNFKSLNETRGYNKRKKYIFKTSLPCLCDVKRNITFFINRAWYNGLHYIIVHCPRSPVHFSIASITKRYMHKIYWTNSNCLNGHSPDFLPRNRIDLPPASPLWPISEVQLFLNLYLRSLGTYSAWIPWLPVLINLEGWSVIPTPISYNIMKLI